MAVALPSVHRPILGFPDVVDEYAARTVAAGVVLLTGAYLATGWGWVLLPLAYGFLARVASGPRFSPLGLLATRVVVPRLGLPTRPVPGPPKRFAQGIGATLSIGAVVLHLAGAPGSARILVGAITGAAFAESAFGFCLGCVIFGRLMALGVVPDTVCAACNNLDLRRASRNS